MSESDASATAPKATGPADLIAAIALTTLFGLSCLAMSLFGVFLTFMTDNCTDTTCAMNVILFGMLLAIVGPWILLIATIVWLVKRFRRQKRVWWVPLAGFGTAIALCAFGAVIAFGGANIS